MKSKRMLVMLGLLMTLGVLALVTACGTGALERTMLYQGRLTNATGTPINGTRDITFRLYTTETGGSSIWQETHNGVQVNNGLFQVVLGETNPLDEANFHQPLWLEVVVAGQTLSPRQPLQGVPYAFSLVPGAVIKGYIASTETYSSTLTIANFSDGQGLAVLSSSGPGLYASGDPAIIADGDIKSTSKSYVWISGNSFVQNINTDSTRWDMQANGAARIWRGSSSGNKRVYYPITLPSVLYGQSVKLTKLTIYYKCEDGSKNYISSMQFTKQTDAASSVTIRNDGTNLTSNTATSYSYNLTSNNTLTAGQGALGLNLNLYFSDNSNYIQIGGIRLELEHD